MNNALEMTAPAMPRDVTETRPALLTRRLGSLFSRLGRAAAIRVLAGIEDGIIEVREGDRSWQFGRESSDGLRARVEVLDRRFWTEILGAGANGGGEAYRQGWWRADDLTSLLRIFARNRDASVALDGGLARLARPLRQAALRANRNTLEGSRENIAAHYDLSNEFFSLILDPSMMYSSGVFPRESSSLEEASIEKIDRLCRKLELQPGDRLLEIGTGWGGFAIHAARHYGVRVTTTTISTRQAEWAERRIREEGFEDRIELCRTDYRDLEGKFDKIVSIEMIEAVGAEYYEEFFRVLQDRLEPHGIAALQAITIADRFFAEARDTEDFIKKYIFPGSCIPSVTALLDAATAASDLKLVQLEDITPHYCRTLAAWRENLFRHRREIRGLGLDDAFERTWDFYFSYCEAGFAERHIGDVHLLFARPGWRGTSAPEAWASQPRSEPSS